MTTIDQLRSRNKEVTENKIAAIETEFATYNNALDKSESILNAINPILKKFHMNSYEIRDISIRNFSTRLEIVLNVTPGSGFKYYKNNPNAYNTAVNKIAKIETEIIKVCEHMDMSFYINPYSLIGLGGSSTESHSILAYIRINL